MFLLFIVILYGLFGGILAVCGGAFGLGYTGILWSKRSLPREDQKTYRAPLGFLGIGGLGFLGIILLNGLVFLSFIFGMVRDVLDTPVSCHTRQVTESYRLLETENLIRTHRGRLISNEENNRYVLSGITSFAFSGHYLLYQNGANGYGWFDLTTGAQRPSKDKITFVNALQQIGIPESPKFISIGDLCQPNQCQVCNNSGG